MRRPQDPNALKRGWNYVIEPEPARDVPSGTWSCVSGDGAVLTKRPHGFPGHIEVHDATDLGLPRAALLRAAAAAGRAVERLGRDPAQSIEVVLGSPGKALAIAGTDVGGVRIDVDGQWLAEVGSRHPVDAALEEALRSGVSAPPVARPAVARGEVRPARRVLFFESLMNTDIDHNDQELSQGVLHMVSALSQHPSTPVLARVKMTIFEQFRHERDGAPAIIGLDRLDAVLADGDIDLVCVTLLEAYVDGVVELIAALRARGCRAPVAVGGVMPTLTPEHVAVHLPDVSFVCRGAGEHFLPALCDVLGGATIDTPFTPEQRRAFGAVRGLLAVDHAGRRLVARDTHYSAQVEDLDRVPLDLSFLRRDHLVHGVEIATSRGCIHKCSFCTIIGQMTYQARSAEGLFELLDRYAQRFHEIFGDAIPERVWRLHFSDDDFACDRARTLAFFRQLSRTRFRLSSCQVSIADLCLKRGKAAIPEVDEELLDAIRADAFFDEQRRITPRAHIEDYGERRWSAYLQMGVESFSDAELTRHAKGYKVAHIRAVMQAMAQRGLHLDAYFILSNVETRAEDLIDALQEACRLKLAHPVHFHVKYPVTPRIVSIYPSASYRRHLRNGKRDQLALRRDGPVAGFPEFDYPFVEHDLPIDPWVELAVEAPFFTHDARYIGSIEALRARWMERVQTLPDGLERRRGERLVRQIDDARRTLVFERLRAVGFQARADQDLDASPEVRASLDTARELLGPASGWLDAYRRDSREGPVVLRLAHHASLALAAGYAASTRRSVIAVAPAATDLDAVSDPGLRVFRAIAWDAPQAAWVGPSNVGLELTLTADADALRRWAQWRGPAAGDVRVRIAAGAWTAALQRQLAVTLQALGGQLGDRLVASERPAIELSLDADGRLLLRGDEVTGTDAWPSIRRVVRDARATSATAAERVLFSYLRWRSGAAAAAASV